MHQTISARERPPSAELEQVATIAVGEQRKERPWLRGRGQHRTRW